MKGGGDDPIEWGVSGFADTTGVVGTSLDSLRITPINMMLVLSTIGWLLEMLVWSKRVLLQAPYTVMLKSAILPCSLFQSSPNANRCAEKSIPTLVPSSCTLPRLLFAWFFTTISITQSVLLHVFIALVIIKVPYSINITGHAYFNSLDWGIRAIKKQVHYSKTCKHTNQKQNT